MVERKPEPTEGKKIFDDNENNNKEKKMVCVWRECGGHTLPTRVFMDENPLLWRQKWGKPTG